MENGGDPTGFHLGAIGNFQVDSIGHGMVKFSTDLWCLGCKEDNDLLDKAVIIHNGTDDYVFSAIRCIWNENRMYGNKYSSYSSYSSFNS
jgi:hypothetical protein